MLDTEISYETIQEQSFFFDQKLAAPAAGLTPDT
jgi:hypothetical protein